MLSSKKENPTVDPAQALSHKALPWLPMEDIPPEERVTVFLQNMTETPEHEVSIQSVVFSIRRVFYKVRSILILLSAGAGLYIPRQSKLSLPSAHHLALCCESPSCSQAVSANVSTSYGEGLCFAITLSS